MSDAEWPAPEPATPRDPERRTTPLPRVEDLPIADQGYDREKVREAFDAFYRHAAQLDATLSTLEAVEVFQRTSAELRAELRNIRGSGWTVQSWQGGTGYAGSGASRGRVSEWTLPPSFPRLAGEFTFLILIGVVVGVAGWSALTIVLVMGLALGVVLLLEWVAARERAIPRAAAPAAAPDLDRDEPAELSVGEAWVLEEGPEALTMLDDAVVEVAVAEAEPEPEPEPEPEAVAPEAEVVEVELAVVEPERAVAEPEPEVVEVEVPVDEPEEPPAAEAVPVVDEPEPVAEAVPDEPLQPELPEEPVEPADVEEHPKPDAEVAELADGDRPRRFRLFGRRRGVVPLVEPEPEAAPVPVEPEQHLDPWEQDAQLPQLPEEEQFAEEQQLVEPPRRSWFRRRAPDEQGELDEPLVAVAAEPESVPEPEPDPEPEPEPEPEFEPEPEPEPEPEEQGPLPVDRLAEQAAAALERSRARRRTPRRARRR